MNEFYKYKYKEESEKIILEKYCNEVMYDYRNEVFFTINTRKFKILILDNNEESVILKNILKNSESKSPEDYLSAKFSLELSKNIDEMVMRDISKGIKDIV